MRNFIKHFEREPCGAWTCISPAEITTVMGRIQVSPGTRFMPGTVFMAVDIVRLLEEEDDKRRIRSPLSELPVSARLVAVKEEYRQ